MKISVLVENSITPNSKKKLKSEHGLSLHIQLGKTQILFDTGKSDLFIRNAREMGIDLSEVNYLIISHGHYDHGGGLKHFLNLNKQATVFMHRQAPLPYYIKLLGCIPYYIGLDPKTINANLERIHFVDKKHHITEETLLLANFPTKHPLPKANLNLYKKTATGFTRDPFNHELLLLLKEKDKQVAFTGCSHSGIINMIEKAKKENPQREINASFGGFHTYNPATKQNETTGYLNALSEEIKKDQSTFFTGHCTGEKNLRYLNEKAENKIKPMRTGDIITL